MSPRMPTSPAESAAAALSCGLSNKQTTAAQKHLVQHFFVLRPKPVKISAACGKSEKYKIRIFIAAFVVALIAVCPLLVWFG